MTLFNGVSYRDIAEMPVGKLDAILNWRVKYEESKHKRIEEEMSKQKAAANKQSSRRDQIKRNYG
jgi:hypothetical protein